MAWYGRYLMLMSLFIYIFSVILAGSLCGRYCIFFSSVILCISFLLSLVSSSAMRARVCVYVSLERHGDIDA